MVAVIRDNVRLLLVAIVALALVFAVVPPAHAAVWKSVPGISCSSNARAQLIVTTNSYNSARWHTVNPDWTIKSGTDSNGDGRIYLTSKNKGYTPGGRVTVPYGFVTYTYRCVSVT